MSPCAAASSYPVVPLICPAKYSPFKWIVSKDIFKSLGSKKSYSIAYPGLVMCAFSNPLILLTNSIWTSKGKLVDIPFGYNSRVLSPSGSIKIWCESLSEKRTTLSSIEGQYRGPTPSISPVNKGERSSPLLIRSWVLSFV